MDGGLRRRARAAEAYSSSLLTTHVSCNMPGRRESHGREWYGALALCSAGNPPSPLSVPVQNGGLADPDMTVLLDGGAGRGTLPVLRGACRRPGDPTQTLGACSLVCGRHRGGGGGGVVGRPLRWLADDRRPESFGPHKRRRGIGEAAARDAVAGRGRGFGWERFVFGVGR